MPRISLRVRTSSLPSIRMQSLTYSFSDGGVFLNNAIPVPDASGMVHVSVFTYFHSFSFFGRTANFTATSPYGVGHFQGTVMDNEAKPYRSGLLDSTFRFSVNLKGGPAMSVKVTGTMAFDRKQYGMNSGIPFIKIADRVEVDLALKVHRLSGAPVNLK